MENVWQEKNKTVIAILSLFGIMALSGCGGVYPGPYSLNMDLSYGNRIIASSSLAINLII